MRPAWAAFDPVKFILVIEPPPRLWWLGRTVRIACAAGRPWLFTLALLGAAGVVFSPWLGTNDWRKPVHPAGPTVECSPTRGPHPGFLTVGWAVRKWPRQRVGWMTWGQSAPGLFWAEIGFDPPATPVPGFGRPPGAVADWFAWRLSWWWLLGPPAALSLFAGWRAVRSEPRPSPHDRRLARPWVALLALVGLGLAVSEQFVPDRHGPGGTGAVVRAQRTPSGSWHPREIFMAIIHQPAGTTPGGGFDWAEGVTIGLWWLVILPLACNLLTLVRRGRPGSVPAG